MSDKPDMRSEKTRPGFATPEMPKMVSIEPPPESRPVTERSVPPASAATPNDIEVEYQVETASKSTDRDHWIALEVSTLNRVYQIDTTLHCIAVLDRNTRAPEASHALLGARLVGGQTPTIRGIELSYPYPRVGAEAVFEHRSGNRVRFSHTSKVTRVVMRVRIVAVEQEQNLSPTWERLTGHHQAVSKRR